MSKGSNPRPIPNRQAYEDNYDLIYGAPSHIISLDGVPISDVVAQDSEVESLEALLSARDERIAELEAIVSLSVN